MRPPPVGAGRFAPTPTGRLHLGNARTALLAWLWARSRGLRNVLRVEDLDPAAVPAGYIEGIYADLDWLGLRYDEEPRRGGPVGPYRQSARFDLYREPLERLDALGLLYPCRCSRKEVQAATRAPHAGDDGPVYPGTCRPLGGASPLRLSDTSRDAPATGRPAALRLDVDRALRLLGATDVAFDDAVGGRLVFDLRAAMGDFVVRRADGVAAYQLACAWDDVEMGCTQVLRGVDLLPSAARQVLLLRLLGRSLPTYAHVGLVLTPAGEKLSKRDASIALADMRAGGVTPEAVRALLARLSGLPETPDLDTLAAAFELQPAWRESVRLPETLERGAARMGGFSPDAGRPKGGGQLR